MLYCFVCAWDSSGCSKIILAVITIWIYCILAYNQASGLWMEVVLASVCVGMYDEIINIAAVDLVIAPLPDH